MANMYLFSNSCCSISAGMGGSCSAIDQFPNATIAEYGTISMDVDKIKAEILARGPVAAGINANPIVDYEGGIFTDDSYGPDIDHVISIVGWGKDEETGVQYWIIRNSWGK